MLQFDKSSLACVRSALKLLAAATLANAGIALHLCAFACLNVYQFTLSCDSGRTLSELRAAHGSTVILSVLKRVLTDEAALSQGWILIALLSREGVIDV